MRTGHTVIVGDQGRMGGMLSCALQEAGHQVAGIDQPLCPDRIAEVCCGAAIVVLCVPVGVLETVITQVVPHLEPETILADIASVKEQPLRIMERLWHGAVVGTHPLFGAQTPKSVERAVCMVSGQRATQEACAQVEALFTDMGCTVFYASAQEHDESMARIQTMNFITSAAYFAMLAEDERLLSYVTPSFRRRLMSAQKLLTEDASMFVGLFDANPYNQEAVRQYRTLLNLAAGGDIDLLVRRAQWWWREGLETTHTVQAEPSSQELSCTRAQGNTGDPLVQGASLVESLEPTSLGQATLSAQGGA